MHYSVAIKRSKISEILQKLLQEKGIHVSELARRTNLKQPTVQRIVSGIYQRPHIKSLKPIAEFFGITIDQLLGSEPLSFFGSSKNELIKKIPLLSIEQIAQYPNIETKSALTSAVVDFEVSNNAYAFKMPDCSMEPLFPKNTLLIIDPTLTPKDRCFVVIKIHTHTDVIFRQLLIDGKEYYIKPLSPDFERFKMAMLTSLDLICGVLVQARMDYQNN